MLYNCIATSKALDSIIIFGLCRTVYAYSWKRMESLVRQGLDVVCHAKDQFGNVYDVYSDYDPCLKASHVVALLVEEATK